MSDLTIQMKYKKATKHTVVYDDQGQDTAIGTVYIQKTAFEPGKFPIMITLEVRFEGDSE